MATKNKKPVKTNTCRAYGSWMSSKDADKRKTGAGKLASKTCKTTSQIKKGTSKIAAISKMAKKIRKKDEAWQSAIKRASKLV